MSSLLALQRDYDLSDSSDSESETHLKETQIGLEDDDLVIVEVRRLMDTVLNKVDHDLRFRHPQPIKSTPNSDDSADELQFSDTGNDAFEGYDEDDYGDLDAFEEPPSKLRPLKTKGELTLNDLPPVEHLHISMQVADLQQIGRVSGIVPPLVVIQAFRNTAALNLDSILFYRDGTAIGSIFDVFGPVMEPNYAIRFNSDAEIASRGISLNMPVYFVPRSNAPITEYVFVSQLRKMKGSDASWLDNNEPPEHVKEYSDDEEERRDQQKSKSKRRHSNVAHNSIQKRNHSGAQPSNYFSRPQQFFCPSNNLATSALDSGQVFKRSWSRATTKGSPPSVD